MTVGELTLRIFSMELLYCERNNVEIGNYLSLTPNFIDVGALTKMASDPSDGAISSFLGITRNNFEGKSVLSLEYEAYNDMALLEMENLCGKVIASIISCLLCMFFPQCLAIFCVDFVL